VCFNARHTSRDSELFSVFKCVGDEEEEGLLSDLPTEIHIQYILIVIEDT
jgi:hypothetical protein